MLPKDTVDGWRRAVAELLRVQVPRGHEFDLCRVLVRMPTPARERGQALRMLLEGSMADSATPIALAQDVMAILRAADRGEIDVSDLAPDP